MNKEKITTIFSIFEKANPHPKTELKYINDYTLLVAVVLSAQATDVGVNKATKDLFALVKTPQQMVNLGLDKLIGYIKTIGLFNSKAKNIMALSKILLEQYSGIVPDSRDLLEKLPGVGRKTANVVLNVAFNQPTMAVDTHIFRVSNRIGIAPGKTPLEVEKALLKNIPNQFLQHAHHWLILHGRYICKARKPNCNECPINKLCKFYEDNKEL
jgi:endonuclease-3